MSKILAEDCRNVSIYKLKEWGCFESTCNRGTIWWRSSWGDENSVRYRVDLDDMKFHLGYSVTDRFTNEKTKVSHSYPIVTTDCHYGSVRYWFICSVYANGKYCGRRVGKLYMGSGSNYFACRHCYDLTYYSRNSECSYSMADLEREKEKIKRWYYNGKPTKKYLAYLKKEATFNSSFLQMFARLSSRLK